MDRVLLQIKMKRERRKLEDWLGHAYRIVLPDPEHPLAGEFDLAIIDGASLKKYRPQVRARRKAEEPVFFPLFAPHGAAAGQSAGPTPRSVGG